MNRHLVGLLKMIAGILFLAFALVLAILVLSTDGQEPKWVLGPAAATMMFAFGLVFWGAKNTNDADRELQPGPAQIAHHSPHYVTAWRQGEEQARLDIAARVIDAQPVRAQLPSA